MRSEEVKLGSTRAAHRSLFYAMGYTEEDLKKPLIGVVNAQNEIIPGHMHLDQIAKAVKHGILSAGERIIDNLMAHGQANAVNECRDFERS